MDILFKVVDDFDNCYGTFKLESDANEQAQDSANQLKKDMYVEKHMTEIVKCVFPE